MADKNNKRRQKAIEKHNTATNIIQPAFELGHFVLVRRGTDRGHKLSFKWKEPRRIVAIHSSLVYSVEKLSGGDIEKVHSVRLTPYRAAAENTIVTPRLLELADKTEVRYEVVDSILDLGEAEDGLFFQVRWEGLPDKRDSTWVKIKNLFEDMPAAVCEFLSTCKKKNLVRKANQQLNILHDQDQTR